MISKVRIISFSKKIVRLKKSLKKHKLKQNRLQVFQEIKLVQARKNLKRAKKRLKSRILSLILKNWLHKNRKLKNRVISSGTLFHLSQLTC